MKAVIMAGGQGSRLRPLTSDRPKPLVPVCNRPVMAYTLDLLAEHGVREVIVTLGYMAAAISNAFGNSYRGMRLRYQVEERPKGTAGGVAALQRDLDSTFLVLSGDTLTDVDLEPLISFHRKSGAMATLAVTRVENPMEYGMVMADRKGRVRRFLEKPQWGEIFSDTINAGIYVLEPAVLVGVPPGISYDFGRHLFPALLEMGAPVYSQILDGYWCDIGNPSLYLKANVDLLSRRLRFSPPGVEVAKDLWSEGTDLQGVLVEGPALIGEGCRLAPGTRLEAGSVLGSATVTGEGSVLRQSVTWSGVQIGARAEVVGTVICDGTVLEGGRTMAPSPGVRLWPETAMQGAVADG